MILDLTVFDEETLDIVMKERTLHVRKPTERMLIETIRLKDVSEDMDPAEAIAKLNMLIWKILNNNTDGIEFEMRSVAALSRELKEKIAYAYVDFIKKIQRNPTSASRRSRARGQKKETRSFFGRFTRWWSTQD